MFVQDDTQDLLVSCQAEEVELEKSFSAPPCFTPDLKSKRFIYAQISKTRKSYDKISQISGRYGVDLQNTEMVTTQNGQNLAKPQSQKLGRNLRVKSTKLASSKNLQRAPSVELIQKDNLFVPLVDKSHRSRKILVKNLEASLNPLTKSGLVRNYSFLQNIRNDFSSLVSR